MPSHRVAALESQGRILLAALGERAGDGWKVVTEDGRAFDYPADRLLWTAKELRVEGNAKKEIGAALKVLRAGAGPAPDWATVRGVVEPGLPLDLAEIAANDAEALSLALGAAAAPGFRIDGGRLVAVTDEEVAAAAARAAAALAAKEAEDGLVEALQSHRTAPASPALDALLGWALGPEDGAPPPVAKRLHLADVYEGLERLDGAGLLPADALPPLSRRSIPREFPRKVLAAELSADAAPREDLRALPTYAVDDAGTFEVDDALSLLRGPGGEPRFLVHIADVAAALEPGSPVDLEARRRATTIYIPDGKIPMIPPGLVEERLSLAAGKDRAAITTEIRVGPDGIPVGVRTFRSLVRVSHPLDYVATAKAEDLPADLRVLFDLARELRRARVEGGARVLELPDLHLRVKDGKPVLELRGIGGAGDVLVGEAMVACNRAAAETLRAAGAAAIWRAQDPPKGDLPPREEPLFSLRARRLFAPVRYSPVPARHSGVGADAYLQVTSPIRRYSDLAHQRQLAAILEGRAPPHAAAEMKEFSADLYRQERLVRAAEAEREDYWVCAWLEERAGEIFDGVVSRPPMRGRGHAWIPALLAEHPFRSETPRAEGTPVRLKPARLARHRGRIEFEAV